MADHTVVVVAFDRISPFHLSVPCLVFGPSQLPFPGSAPRFDLRVVAETPGSVETSAGFSILINNGLDALHDARTIIVPSWPTPDTLAPRALIDALRTAAARGADIVGLCLGAYVLAEAGLLDGRRATTHWAFADDFSRRYPDIEVDADKLYVEDGNMLTSAGTAAGIDCCLHLLRRDYGADYANSVARRLVVAPHRQGGQAQYIERPIPANGSDSRMAALLDEIRENLGETHTLDSLARKVSMSRRTFTRHFRLLTGCTVVEWLLRERLALAQRLLESSDQSVEHIAELAGFGSPASLRHHFRRELGVSPLAWRHSFRGDATDRSARKAPEHLPD